MNHPIRLLFIVLIFVGTFFLWRQVNEPIQIVNDEQVVDQTTEAQIISDKGVELYLTTPKQGSILTSPLVISGEAPGTWFFEASFPVVLVDWDGLIISEGYVTAKDDWMTEDLVSFEGDLEFETPTMGKSGTLILRKDNPSDLPQNDDAAEVLIFFQ
jgi:hypothetical protein